MAARKRSAPGRGKRQPKAQAKQQNESGEPAAVPNESPRGNTATPDSAPIAHLHDMDRIDPNGFVAHLRAYNLAEGRELWKYKETIQDLQRVLHSDATVLEPGLYASALIEGVIIVLLTTAAGTSVLQTLKHLTYFSEAGDPQQRALVQLKAWQKNNRTTNYQYISLKQEWSRDQMGYILRLLRFLIVNRDSPIDVTLYNNPKHKLSLGALFDSSTTRASLTLDPQYNVLLDFLIYFQPQIDTMLEVAMRSSLITKVVKAYHRVYEFNARYAWYDLVPQGGPDGTVPSGFTYLYMMKMRLDEPEEMDDEKTGNDTQSTSISGLARAEEWCGDIVFKNSIYVNDASETGNPMIRKHITAKEQVLSWDLDHQNNAVLLPDMVAETVARHNILYRVLKLDTLCSPFLATQFKLVSGLVDPLTQPLPNDAQVISIDLLCQMFIGLAVGNYGVTDIDNSEGFDWRFLIAFNMQKIISQSLQRLNCSRYADLVSISNNSEQHWKHNLHKWLPVGLNTQDLELIYMIDILAVYTIYSLYSHLPIQMNPFLSSLIKLWKHLSCVILLGLEIDRVEEVHETFETPLMVRATIRGATALRAVVATILNQHVDKNMHDFKHESFNTFMSPFGRKLCQGALLADLRTHAAAMFALGCEMKDITELLADLQAGDRFDEDVRYMFEYEYDDYNDVDYDDPDTDLAEPEISGAPIVDKAVHRRCNCIFEDDKVAQANDDTAASGNGWVSQDSETVPGQPKTPTDSGVNSRVKSSFEFDYSGNDWRDVPRDFNLYFTPNYHFIPNPTVENTYKLILKATNEKLDQTESMELLESVASCVKIEQEQMILQATGIDKLMKRPKTEEKNDGKLVTPDDIYEIWCEESAFERMLYENQELSWRLMDEMLMCSGYRRVLIWFITHMEINHTLIHYIFELAMGMRGNAPSEDSTGKQTKSIVLAQLMADENKPMEKKSEFSFSRQGSIKLSEIENKMLLQEFFTSAAIFLSSGESQTHGDSTEPGDANLHNPVREGDNVSLYSIGLIKLICYMVQSLIKTKKFDFSKSECTFELQTLLMTWVGVIPEAQELFFLLKTTMADASSPEDEESQTEDSAVTTDSSGAHAFEIDGSHDDKESSMKPEDIPRYNNDLLGLFPPEGGDSSDNIAVETLTAFLKKYSLTAEVPTMGRKILHYEDTILPLADIDKPQSMSNIMHDGSEIEFYF